MLLKVWRARLALFGVCFCGVHRLLLNVRVLVRTGEWGWGAETILGNPPPPRNLF